MLSPEKSAGVECLAAQLEVELDGWKVDCCLTFGSTARDEAIAGSDVDLWFIGHAPERIYLDRTWRQGRFATDLEKFLAEHSQCEVTDIDTWGAIQPKVGLAAPFVFGTPLSDTRWLLWQLAEEREWQLFLFVATSEAVIDRHGFFGGLQDFLWGELPFHIHPDHGIVSTLKQLCEGEKLALMRDLGLLSGAPVEGPKAEHTVWVWPAVECVRDSVVLLSLVRDGRPVFRRRDVLEFVHREFPEHLVAAQQVYRYKATEEGRQELRELVEAGSQVCQRELQPITETVVSFWHAAMAEADRCILRGRSRIRHGEVDWRERNHAAYRRFYSDYLARLQAAQVASAP